MLSTLSIVDQFDRAKVIGSSQTAPCAESHVGNGHKARTQTLFGYVRPTGADGPGLPWNFGLSLALPVSMISAMLPANRHPSFLRL
jgi:hypothetical protein